MDSKGFLLIERKGSGWGGIYGQALLDLQNGHYFLLNSDSYVAICELLQKAKIIDNAFIKEINAMLDYYCCTPIKTIDVSKYTAYYLDTAKIIDDGCCMLDQQADIISLITQTYMKPIYSTLNSNVFPENNKLKKWCYNLLEMSCDNSKNISDNFRYSDVHLMVRQLEDSNFMDNLINLCNIGHSNIVTYHGKNISEIVEKLKDSLIDKNNNVSLKNLDV